MDGLNPWVYAAAFAGPALLAWGLVRASIAASHRWQVYDHPDGGRKTQDRPIPRGGGVAVAAAFTAAFLAAVAAVGRADELSLLAGVVLPALGMALLGFADDTKGLGAGVRLAAQAVLAVAVFAAGTRVQLGDGALDLVVTVGWVVVLTNALNLMDNSDGLAATTTLVASLGSAVVAGLYGQFFIAGLAIALAGVSAGFLWHNWHPATVYLGDAGAYFLGFLLAVVTLRLRPADLPLPWSAAIPVLLVAVPLADTCFVVVRRLREGRHPFQPGRDHLAHLLQDAGLHVTRAVLALQVVLLGSVAAAIAMAAATH